MYLFNYFQFIVQRVGHGEAPDSGAQPSAVGPALSEVMEHLVRVRVKVRVRARVRVRAGVSIGLGLGLGLGSGLGLGLG